MDVNEIARRLQKKSWKYVRVNSSFEDYQFDVIAQRRFMLFSQWFVLVRKFEELDDETLKTHLNVFKSLAANKNLMYVLVTKRIDSELGDHLNGDSWLHLVSSLVLNEPLEKGAKTSFKDLLGVTGNVIIYNSTSNKWYGAFEGLSSRTAKISYEMKNLFA